jgi:antitoxin MazE
MNAVIKKWGNSLALRIPKSFAEELKLGLGSQVSIKLYENNIVITPIVKKKRRNKYNLKVLVSQITSENHYGEINTGFRVGKEII